MQCGIVSLIIIVYNKTNKNFGVNLCCTQTVKCRQVQHNKYIRVNRTCTQIAMYTQVQHAKQTMIDRPCELSFFK